MKAGDTLTPNFAFMFKIISLIWIEPHLIYIVFTLFSLHHVQHYLAITFLSPEAALTWRQRRSRSTTQKVVIII